MGDGGRGMRDGVFGGGLDRTVRVDGLEMRYFLVHLPKWGARKQSSALGFLINIVGGDYHLI